MSVVTASVVVVLFPVSTASVVVVFPVSTASVVAVVFSVSVPGISMQ